MNNIISLFIHWRHSAANNLAIVLKGSDQLRIAWTDYSDNHVKNIRNYILAESTSLEDRAMFGNIWLIC